MKLDTHFNGEESGSSRNWFLESAHLGNGPAVTGKEIPGRWFGRGPS
jgi:hypothetical protein